MQAQSLLEKMTTQEIVLGIISLKSIYLKSECDIFQDEKFAEGLLKASESCPQLRDIFREHTDGVANYTDTFSNIMGFSKMGKILQTVDLVYTRMTNHGREYIQKLLQDQYGANALEVLHPIAAIVWEEVRNCARR
jgi:hypothetical protein